MSTSNVVTPNLSQCEYAEFLSLATPVQIVQWIEIVFDIVAFCSLTFFLRSKYFRKVAKLANPNMKIIFFTGIFFYYVAILWSLVLHIYFKIRVYSYNLPCDLLWNPLQCIIFRLPVFYSFVCFSIFHLVLFIERAITTFCKVQIKGIQFGIWMSLLTILIPAIIIAIALTSDNFQDTRAYCFSNSSMKPIVVVVCMSITSLLDIFVTFGDTYIYFYNRRSVKNKHMTQYSLSNSFRLRETNMSMNIIFPFASFHAGLFLLYVFSVIVSNFLGILNSLDKSNAILQVVGITKSIYLAGVPLLVLIFVRGENSEEWLIKQQQIPSQAYFDQFNAQVMPQVVIPPSKNY